MFDLNQIVGKCLRGNEYQHKQVAQHRAAGVNFPFQMETQQYAAYTDNECREPQGGIAVVEKRTEILDGGEISPGALLQQVERSPELSHILEFKIVNQPPFIVPERTDGEKHHSKTKAQQVQYGCDGGYFYNLTGIFQVHFVKNGNLF